jgi:UDP-N-acetylmuramyl pentapeptide phosphotransferase/UDP-N-acetylglucosamine-1-phosphate transferase
MKSHPHDPQQHALAILRICLWFIPGVMLAMALFLMPHFGLSRSWSFPILLIAFFFIGYFDMMLKLHIEETDPKPIRYSLLTWALAFASIQIIIAPAVLFLIHYCYQIFCNIAGIP